MRLVVSKRASDRRAAARNTVGRFETGVLATDDNQDGLVAVPAVRPSTGSRAVRGPLLPLGGLPGASAGAARAAPAPSLDFRHVGIYGVDYGFLDFTNYKFSDPSAGATYARLVHEAKERGQIVTLGLYTWDRVSHKKPLEEVLADTNRILDAVNLQEVDLICLHEEEVDWQGGFEYLNAVYDHVKQKYPGPVYQWYSMPMGPRWDQKADGWILDAYGMDYATFRRHLMRSLRPLPRRSSAHLPAAKAGWRTDSATSSFVSAPTTVGAQPKRPLSRPRRPPQGVARTGLRSWGAYGNRAGGWMVEVLRTVPIPGAGDAERAGVDGTGGMPSRLRHPGPPMEHGRRSSQRHTR